MNMPLLSRDTLLTLSALPELLHCREAAVGPWLREHGIKALRGPGKAPLYRWGDVLDAMAAADSQHALAAPQPPARRSRKSASGTLPRVPLR